jgi:hypothetical protein
MAIQGMRKLENSFSQTEPSGTGVDGPLPDNAGAYGWPAETARESKAEPTGRARTQADGAEGGGRVIDRPRAPGDEDPSGLTIQQVFTATRQFIIYEADDQVRYMLPDNYEVAKELRKKVADLGGLRASIDNLRADKALRPDDKMRAARETAWALTLALEHEPPPPTAVAAGEFNDPKDILTRVDTRLRSLVKSHHRKRYVLANLTAFLAIEAFLIIAVLALNALPIPKMAAVPNYAMYGMFGALGAFLSVITRVGSIDVDLNLDRWEHVFAGVTRILIGVIGAVVIGLALDSRFIDPTFGSPWAPNLIADRMAMYFLFAFLAGFSESLVPNLLRRGDQAAGGTDKQHGPIVETMKP